MDGTCISYQREDVQKKKKMKMLKLNSFPRQRVYRKLKYLL